MIDTPTYDPEKSLWSIMTKSHGGTVSIVRDLTLAQARQTYERLDPWYGHHSEQFSVHKDFLKDGVLWSCSAGCGRVVSDGDIEIREVFGPEGWGGFAPGEVKHRPTFTTIWTDDKGEILSDEYQDDVGAAERNRCYREMSRPKAVASSTTTERQLPWWKRAL